MLPLNGHLRLRNVANPQFFLAVRHGLLASGHGPLACAAACVTRTGGRHCEFVVQPLGNDIIELQGVCALCRAPY